MAKHKKRNKLRKKDKSLFSFWIALSSGGGEKNAGKANNYKIPYIGNFCRPSGIFNLRRILLFIWKEIVF